MLKVGRPVPANRNFAGHSPKAEQPTPSSSSEVARPGHTALVEFCCGPRSLISQEGSSQGLVVLRIIKDSHDLTREASRAKARADIGELAAKHRVHLWASLPCKPWCP